jgi:hypothetical protein
MQLIEATHVMASGLSDRRLFYKKKTMATR